VGQRLAAVAGGQPRRLGVLVEGEPRRRPEVRGRQAGAGEDRADAVEVEGLSGVRGAGERQERPVEVEAVAQHRDGLQGLERRSGQHGGARVAEREPGVAAGARHGQRPVVETLEMLPAPHLGQNRIRCTHHAGSLGQEWREPSLHGVRLGKVPRAAVSRPTPPGSEGSKGK